MYNVIAQHEHTSVDSLFGVVGTVNCLLKGFVSEGINGWPHATGQNIRVIDKNDVFSHI